MPPPFADAQQRGDEARCPRTLTLPAQSVMHNRHACSTDDTKDVTSKGHGVRRRLSPTHLAEDEQERKHAEAAAKGHWTQVLKHPSQDARESRETSRPSSVQSGSTHHAELVNTAQLYTALTDRMRKEGTLVLGPRPQKRWPSDLLIKRLSSSSWTAACAWTERVFT